MLQIFKAEIPHKRTCTRTIERCTAKQYLAHVNRLRSWRASRQTAVVASGLQGVRKYDFVWMSGLCTSLYHTAQ